MVKIFKKSIKHVYLSVDVSKTRKASRTGGK